MGRSGSKRVYPMVRAFVFHVLLARFRFGSRSGRDVILDWFADHFILDFPVFGALDHTRRISGFDNMAMWRDLR
jgi:hypothetical protein